MIKRITESHGHDDQCHHREKLGTKRQQVMTSCV